MSVILETGVDKLISLIEKNEKLSFDLAAQKLGFSPTIIKNWAELLEEAGIISIEYIFTVPYLVINKKTNQKTKIKEKDQKDLFVTRTKIIENKLFKWKYL